MPNAEELLASTKAALNSIFLEIRQDGDEALIAIHTQTIRSLYARATNIAARRYLKAAEAEETAFFGTMEAIVTLLVKAALR